MLLVSSLCIVAAVASVAEFNTLKDDPFYKPRDDPFYKPRDGFNTMMEDPFYKPRDGMGTLLRPSQTLFGAVKDSLTQKQPTLLTGNKGGKKTLKDTQDIAVSAKKLLDKTQEKTIKEATAKDGGKLQIISEKLNALGKKINPKTLNKDDKLLNNIVMQGVQNEGDKIVNKLKNQIDVVLAKENAPTPAKLLSQVLTSALVDVSKKQLSNWGTQVKVAGTADIPLDDDDYQGVDDDDAAADDQSVDDDDADQGVDDDDADADAGVGDDEEDPGSRPYSSGGQQKKVCLYTPGHEYCVSQNKGL